MHNMHVHVKAKAALMLNLMLIKRCRAKREEAAAARARYISLEGDHVTLLNVFRIYRDMRPKDRRDWASGSFLSERALRRGLDIHNQLIMYIEVCRAAATVS